MVIVVTVTLGAVFFLAYLLYLVDFIWASRRDWSFQPATAAARRARRAAGRHLLGTYLRAEVPGQRQVR